MALIVVGVNHRGATLDIRERIAYRASEAGDALAALRDDGFAGEAVLLSTCNRTEFYLVEENDGAVPAVWAALSARLGQEASGFGYVRRDRDAVAHLFRVASGLDSMVLGE